MERTFKRSVYLLLMVSMIIINLLGENVYAGTDGTFSFQQINKWQLTDSIEEIAINADGYVYATDSLNSRIIKYNQLGSAVSIFGSYGTGDGQFGKSICGITIDSNNNIYVCDSLNNRIQKFSKDGVFIGKSSGNLSYPKGIDIDSKGNVYVISEWSNKIVKFSSDLKYINSWGSYGNGDGQFDYPDDLVIDAQDNIFIVDDYDGSRYGNRVQKFTVDGNFLIRFGSLGSGDGQFDHAQGVAVDSKGNIYVTDYSNNRVVVYNSDGIYLTKWGKSGSSAGEFDKPYDILIDDMDRVFIIEVGNNKRVQVFSTNNQTPVLTTPPPTVKTQVTSSVQGDISLSGEMDTYSFYATDTAVYTIQSMGFLDTTGFLYDANMNFMVECPNGGLDTNFLFKASLVKGQLYFVSVSGANSNYTGGYALLISGPSPGVSISNIQTQNMTATTQGDISKAGESDLYTFYVSKSGNYSIESTGNLDTYGYLLDSNKAIMIKNDDDAGNFNFLMNANLISGNTYTIKVRAFSSNSTGSYGIKVIGPSPQIVINKVLPLSSVPYLVPNVRVRSVSSDMITIAWDQSIGAEYYKLYKNGTFEANVNGTAYIDTRLASNTQYSYSISGVNANGEGAKSSNLYVTTLMNLLLAPQNLRFNAVDVNKITLAWDSVSGANRYYIYKDGMYKTSVTGLEFTDTGLNANTQYGYSVSAVGTNSEGFKSVNVFVRTKEANVTSTPVILPSTPKNLRFPIIESNKVTIAWDNVSGSNSYKVYSQGTLLATVTGNEYTHSGLSPDTQYGYAVSAVNNNGEGQKSDNFFVRTTKSGITTPPVTGSFEPNLRSDSYNEKANPFIGPVHKYYGQCTWYAWGRAHEVLGIRLITTGNAKTWYSNTNLSKGTTPKSNSIIVWTNSTYGHVAYVEKVEGDMITFTESNWDRTALVEKYTIEDGIYYYSGTKTMSLSAIQNRLGYQLLGFIYLQ